jgi:phage major head subunit gpT-like protein
MQFYGVEGSTSSVEYSQGIGALGLVPEFDASAAEGQPGAIEYDSFDSLHEKTFTHREYAKGTSIARKLADDDQRGLIQRKAQSLGFSFGTTRATHATSVFNDAFATVLGADGVVLCSASHPVNEVSDDTFSNLGTSALSYASVVATITAGQDLNDDRGNPMPSIFDTILVPTALRAKSIEITGMPGKPGTADNDASAIEGIRTVVDPYLTDTNNWWMIDSRQSNMHLLWFNRVMPGLTLDPSSDFNLVAKYRGYMRYSFGWDSARWLFGHNVS